MVVWWCGVTGGLRPKLNSEESLLVEGQPLGVPPPVLHHNPYRNPTLHSRKVSLWKGNLSAWQRPRLLNITPEPQPRASQHD